MNDIYVKLPVLDKQYVESYIESRFNHDIKINLEHSMICEVSPETGYLWECIVFDREHNIPLPIDIDELIEYGDYPKQDYENLKELAKEEIMIDLIEGD